MGALAYGFDETAQDDPLKANQSGAAIGGGVSGSQVGSQTAAQGAGITPAGGFTPSYNFGSPDANPGGISGQVPQGIAAGEPNPNAPGGIGGMQTQVEPTRATMDGGASSPEGAGPDFSGMLSKIQSATNPQDAAVAQDQLARNLSSTLTNAGHDVKWKDQNTLIVDGREYTVAGAGGTANAQQWSAQAAATPPLQGMPSDLANWRPTTDTLYTPGDINFNDIPDFTRESLMQELMGGQTNQNTDALVNDILKNPTALSDQVVDTMKAQQKNTLAEQQRQEEEDLRGFGAQSGISDSRWLANQMAQSRRTRDVGVAKAAQDVDIEAAKTRMGDKQAAAQLGLAAGQARSQNIQAATSQSLARAAAVGDRTQLREQVKQAAAQLRISQDQVMSNFVLEKEKNLLQKYGIDLGAQIDASKLNEQSQEFKEDLAFKMQQLEQTMAMQGRSLGQQGDEFNRELQYKYDVFNQGNADNDWQREFLMSQLGGG